MISMLVESALRSLLLAPAVWLGLRLFRIRNVVAEKLAWTVVLAAALAMPLIAPVIARWQPLPAATLTLPVHPMLVRANLPAQPMQDRPEEMTPATASALQPAGTTAQRQIASLASGAAASADEQPEGFALREAAPQPADRFPDPMIEQAGQDAPPIAPARNRSQTIAGLISIAYLAVGAALLFRLLYGLSITISLWRSATPVLGLRFGAGLRVRSSASVASPVTIGSGILLPEDFGEWDSEKLRVVLAHERSHIRQGDFYLQLLAGLYSAAVWPSPLGWWLKHKLSDLGEAIGDRYGLEEARSYSSYAQVLLDFAAAPRPTMIGVAMARPSNVARRIERLLNPSAFRQAFAGGRRVILAAMLVPAGLFAATALVRVQAASQPAQQAPPAQEPLTGQMHPQPAKPAPAPGAAPEASSAPSTAPAPASAPAPSPAPAPRARVGWPMHVEVPALHIAIPAVHVDVPAQHFDVPAQRVDVPAVHVDVPAQQIDVPAIHVDVPAKQIDIPATHFDMPPAGASNNSRQSYPGKSGGELVAMLSGSDAVGLGHMFVQPAHSAATEATFDRTLAFNGKLDLHISNGAGNIHFTRGPANQVKIHATVRSSDADDAEQVRNLASNPPIEQNGNTIRIGNNEQRRGTNHISIDYEIAAPADAALDAISGSGDIVDQGVGQGARLQTGSGNITATGLGGGFTTQTGSGNIAIQNTGEGDARAQTGSGNIAVTGVRGAFRAQTGSGEIKAEGAPVSAWRLETGSGSIEFSPGSAPVTLDASTGSGSITSAREMTMRTSSDRHRVRGQLNGGGPEVRLETGSGDIRVN